jgi:hypothetical protein
MEIACVICLDPIDELPKVFPCNHNDFHIECLLAWRRRSRTCPLCQQDITRVEMAPPPPVPFPERLEEVKPSKGKRAKQKPAKIEIMLHPQVVDWEEDFYEEEGDES